MSGALSVVATGTFFDAASAPTNQRSAAFTTAMRTSEGRLLVTCRLGTTRETPDGHTAIFASDDLGASWELTYLGLGDTTIDGVAGETRVWIISEPTPGELVGSVVWVDRSDPQAPYINPQTQGLLPMAAYLVRSHDGGRSWHDRRLLDLSPHPSAPPTSPIIVLEDGTWVQPFEHWKGYQDAGIGRPRALLRLSYDRGLTWPAEIVVAAHPRNEIFYWDQKLAVNWDTGAIVAMFWTQDRLEGRDLPVHIAWGRADATQWSVPVSTGLDGQHCQPVYLGDGRLLAVYAHREHPGGMRAVLSRDFGASWDGDTEVVLYESWQGQERGAGVSRTQAQAWDDMGGWTFGHPSAVRLPTGEVFAVFYGGSPTARSGRWARIAVHDGA